MFDQGILKLMKAIDVRPLKYLAAVTVAMTVCESEDVQCFIGRLSCAKGNGRALAYTETQWIQIETKVRRKLNQTGVPDLIIDIILENLWPISFEISKWMIYHAEDTGIDFSSNFCWTPQKNIDYLKTAQILFKKKELDIKKRYRLACIYCIGSEVRSLFDQMSLSEKRSFFLRGNLKNSNQNLIILYWTYYIQQVPVHYWRSEALKETQLFKYAVEKGYLRATKFFLQKLEKDLKRCMVFNSFNEYLRKLYNPEFIVKDHLAIVFFLKSLPSSYSGPYQFFKTLLILSFLEWPLQNHFLTVIDRVSRRLWKTNSGELLEGVFIKDIGGYKDHDYKELFRKLWHKIPGHHKIYVNRESQIGYKIFMKFVKTHFAFLFEEDSFVIKAKFRSFISEQEVSGDETNFEKENVNFFKFMIQEKVITKESINRFSLLQDDFMTITFPEYGPEFNLPLGEILYLIDRVLYSESLVPSNH